MSGRTHHNPAPLSKKGSSCRPCGKNLRVFPDSEGEPLPAAVNSFRCPNRGECFLGTKARPWLVGGAFPANVLRSRTCRVTGMEKWTEATQHHQQSSLPNPPPSQRGGGGGGRRTWFPRRNSLASLSEAVCLAAHRTEREEAKRAVGSRFLLWVEVMGYCFFFFVSTLIDPDQKRVYIFPLYVTSDTTVDQWI